MVGYCCGPIYNTLQKAERGRTSMSYCNTVQSHYLTVLRRFIVTRISCASWISIRSPLQYCHNTCSRKVGAVPLQHCCKRIVSHVEKVCSTPISQASDSLRPRVNYHRCACGYSIFPEIMQYVPVWLEPLCTKYFAPRDRPKVRQTENIKRDDKHRKRTT